MTKQAKNASGWLPVGDRILVKRKGEDAPEEKKTKSGIIIPDSSTSERERAKQSPVVEVVAVPEKMFETTLIAFNVGDTLLISAMGNDTVKVKGVEYLLVPVENILAQRV